MKHLHTVVSFWKMQGMTFSASRSFTCLLKCLVELEEKAFNIISYRGHFKIKQICTIWQDFQLYNCNYLLIFMFRFAVLTQTRFFMAACCSVQCHGY